MSSIDEIYRFPVKGLSAERLERVALAPGDGLPLDRAFAIAHGSTAFDPDHPKFLPKTKFLMLAANERLAALETRFGEADKTLTVLRGGKQVARGRLDQPVGRKLLEQFFAAYMKEEAHGAPKIVSAPGHRFDDVGRKVVSIINMASIRDLERVLGGKRLHPLRFRGNLYVEGLPAWKEFDWLDREIRAGSVRMKVVKRIPRCPATDVDPESATREGNIPRSLMGAFGHRDLGVYAEVTGEGEITTGDAIAPC